jgi:hypothetical protein
MLARVCLVCALGLACGIAFAGGVTSAQAADDPVPTTPEPAPDPAPVPAPTPAPKPKPKPAPRQPVSQPRTTSVTPTPAPVVHSAPTVPTQSTKPAVKQRVVHKKAHAKRKLHPKPSTSLPKVVTPKHARSGVLGTQTAGTLSSDGSIGFGSLLLLAMIAIAIACFGVAAIPAVYVPWRPAAYFIAHRNLDIAIAGLGLLFLAGFLVLVTGV